MEMNTDEMKTLVWGLDDFRVQLLDANTMRGLTTRTRELYDELGAFLRASKTDIGVQGEVLALALLVTIATATTGHKGPADNTCEFCGSEDDDHTCTGRP